MEVDLRRKLTSFFTAFRKDFRVKYEGLHMICFGCKRYGHRAEHCMESVDIQTNQVQQNQSGAMVVVEVGGSSTLSSIEGQQRNLATENQGENQAINAELIHRECECFYCRF